MRMQMKYMLCSCLLLAGWIIICILYTRISRNTCSFICEKFINRGPHGHYRTILDYQQFYWSNVGQFIPSGDEANFTPPDSSSTIDCQYHAAQVAFFTRQSSKIKLYGKYSLTGTILLQYRHDARISLPGGGVKFGETILQGLQRELTEEIDFRNVDTLTYAASYYNPHKSYCGHLFTKEMSFDELRNQLTRAISSNDVGIENMGYFFLPTYNELEDSGGFDGLPTFMATALSSQPQSNLIGNTLQQIIHVLTEHTSPAMLATEHFSLSVTQACRLMRFGICSREGEAPNHAETLSNFFN